MAVAIRRSPASPLDLTRFAQVEAASSPVLRRIPKRIPHPVGWGILFGAGDEARTRYRHPTNGCRHSWAPCLTSDQTCFAQVEAATSSLPAVSFQKRKSHPDGWDFLFWSGRRGSNSLPRPWQGRALPDELRPQMTPMFQRHGASGRSRTNDTRIFSPLLYQLSYRGIWRPRWGSNPRPPA